MDFRTHLKKYLLDDQIEALIKSLENKEVKHALVLNDEKIFELVLWAISINNTGILIFLFHLNSYSSVLIANLFKISLTFLSFKLLFKNKILINVLIF